jgi:hypothetical protein
MNRMSYEEWAAFACREATAALNRLHLSESDERVVAARAVIARGNPYAAASAVNALR